MDSFKRLCHYGADAEQVRSFRSPVAGASHAVIDPAENDEAFAAFAVFLGGVENCDIVAFALDFCISAFRARCHFVFNADVGESAAGHNPVVAAARAVGVEIFLFHAVFAQIFPRGAVRENRTGGRDMVGRDRVAENCERPQVFKRRELRRGHRKVCEERRILNVCAFRIPFVDASARAFYFLPAFGAAHIGVAFFEHFAFDVCGDRFRDFLRRRPNVGEENVFAFVRFCERFSVEVDVDPSRARECHHERRAHQRVGFQERVDAGFKISVARQHACAAEVVGFYRFGNFGVYRP